MKDGVAARDALLLTTVLAQAGIVADDAPIAAYVAHHEYDDAEIEPYELVSLLWSVHIRSYVVDGLNVSVPHAAKLAARAGRVVFVWMQPDAEFAARHWALLHKCDGGSLRLASYPPSGGGHAKCYSLAKPSTGQCVLTMQPFVGPAAPEEENAASN